VPDTLADAVLARAEALTPAARQTASAAAVLGRSFDVDLLSDVVAAPVDEVADSLRQLRDRYFVQPGIEAGGYDFRHALIREALYGDIPLPLRRALHGRWCRRARPAACPTRSCPSIVKRAGQPEPPTRTRTRAAAGAAALIVAP
jgi:predicted ATPase